jgi:aspartate/methionine/tyrosine aminotransferase
MLPAIEYLAWAQQHYPTIRFDLATSGLSQLSASELAELEGPAAPAAVPRLDDYSAWKRYREAVASRFGVTADEVAPALGASGGIFLAYASLFDQGDEVLIEQPTYEPMLRVAEGLGLQVRRLPRHRAGGYAVDVAEVERALTPRTRAVVLTDLHNPSGVAADHEALSTIAAMLAPRGGYLVVDEVYAEIVAAGRTARRLAPNVVTFGSLTKCYGVSWPRAGYMLCSPEIRARAERVTLHIAGMLPTPTAVVGLHAFERIGGLEARRERLQAGKRAKVDAFLEGHRGVLSWEPPHPGSLFGLVHDARGRDLRPLLEAGAREHGVLAAPGSFFDAPSAFRLGWSLPAELLDEALARLALALELPARDAPRG